MSDELLPYYKQELEYFGEVAPEFARRHPAIAGRLRMSRRDRRSARRALIQAVAFLNARTRLKIDDEFPEISQALLQVLYPHYLAPFPSATHRAIRAAAGSGGAGSGFLDPTRLQPGNGADRRRSLSVSHVLPGDGVADRDHQSRRAQHRPFPMPATRWKENVARASGWS